MKIKDLKDFINSTTDFDDYDLVIKVKSKGFLHFSTPTVNIYSMQVGFDWDSGKFILGTKEKLCIKKKQQK